jgi:hypothetical protein
MDKSDGGNAPLVLARVPKFGARFAQNEKSRTIQELIPNPMFEEMSPHYFQKESTKRITLL